MSVLDAIAGRHAGTGQSVRSAHFRMLIHLSQLLITSIQPGTGCANMQDPKSLMFSIAMEKDKKTLAEPQLFSRQDFKDMLTTVLEEAVRAGATHCDVRAADLHARVGGYPGRGHSLPTCCSAMREMMKEGDEVLIEPARGHGPAFQVSYLFPR